MRTVLLVVLGCSLLWPVAAPAQSFTARDRAALISRAQVWLPGASDASSDAGGAPRAHRDALRLLAVFLQHTDSKPEQQRLVCLDGPLSGASCSRPFMMLNDVGLTFGRSTYSNTNATSSVNRREWTRTTVWKGDVGCVGNLPKSFTGTMRDPVIGEAGRQFLAARLSELSDRQIGHLFEVADVERRTHGGAGIGGGTVDEWVAAFKAKRQQIVDRRCTAPWSSEAPALFDTGTNVRLQSLASAPLTAVMNAVSMLGYARAYLALGVLVAFAVSLRAGAALLLVVALTGVLTDAAKTAAGMPRPDAVDSRVQALTDIPFVDDTPTLDTVAGTALDDGAYGFPSGHVATTTAFAAGLVLFAGWRRAWLPLAAWVAVMALSRLYLGRHFPIDILGGMAVGAVAVGIVARLRLERLYDRALGWRTALRVGGVGVAGAVLALTLGMPPAYEAGRLLGIALSVLVLVLTHRFEDAVGWRLKAVHIAAAVVLFAAAWSLTSLTVDASGDAAPTARLFAGAFPAFVFLTGPIAVGRLLALRFPALGRTTRPVAARP